MSAVKFHWIWTQIRVKSAVGSKDFFVKHFKFTPLVTLAGEGRSTTLLTTPKGDKSAAQSIKTEQDALQYAANNNLTLLRLTSVDADENDDSFKVNNGNVEEEGRGFGHVAVNVDDVYATCDQLVKEDVKFQKKPDEGRMKGLAFALSPDKYWIEVVGRHSKMQLPPNFSQTMLRVKDAQKSLKFYQALGMSIVAERHFDKDKGDFSLYFLAVLPDDVKVAPTADERFAMMKDLWPPVLELTHNHGTENDDSFSYLAKPEKGFIDLCFSVSDLAVARNQLAEKGIAVDAANICNDPDGYQVQLKELK